MMFERVMNSEPAAKAVHLDEGVYAAFDGHRIWLEKDGNVITLNYRAFFALLTYAAPIWAVKEA